jgi:lysophospholipase L1-like esterase
MRRRRLLFLATLVLLAPVALTACRLAESRRLVRASTPFQRAGSGPAILVVGDSTGEGTGASDGIHSIAGRLGARWPDAPVVNRSRDGAKLAEIAARLRDEAAPGTRRERYRVVVVMGGGNDILQGRGEEDIARDLAEAFSAAKALDAPVFFMGAGNVGTAPMFAWPFSWILTRRARAAQAVFDRVAREAGVTRINLFHEAADDPFLRDPKRFYAPDGLHPGDDGYGLWWDELEKVLPRG